MTAEETHQFADNFMERFKKEPIHKEIIKQITIEEKMEDFTILLEMMRYENGDFEDCWKIRDNESKYTNKELIDKYCLKFMNTEKLLNYYEENGYFD